MGSWLLSTELHEEGPGLHWSVQSKALLESMSAFDQSIDGFNEALELVDQRNVLVCGFYRSMQLGLGGQNVFDGFEKRRRTLVELAYRKL